MAKDIEISNPDSGLTVSRFESVGKAANQAAKSAAFSSLDLAKNSIIRYEKTLGLFGDFIESLIQERYDFSDPTQWVNVTHGLIEGFKQQLVKDGYAFSTVNGDLAIIKKFSRLAFKAGILPEAEWFRIREIAGFKNKINLDENRAVSRRGFKKSDTVWVTDLQALKLKEEHPDTPRGWRDRLICNLLLDYGFRASEVAGLLIESIDFSTNLLKVWRPKVKKWQRFHLMASTLKVLKGYLQVIGNPTEGPLLRRTTVARQIGGAMSAVDISLRVRALGLKLGIKGLSAHDMRHFWTAKALQNGSRHEDVQRAGGWSTSKMVDYYSKENEVANDGVII